MLTYRHLKIALVALLSVFALLAVVLAATFVWAFTNPQKAWDFASKRFLPSDLTVGWEKMDFQSRRQGWRHWDVVWDIDRLSIEKVSPAVHAPAAAIRVKLSVQLFAQAPAPWFMFEEVSLSGAEAITFHPGSEKSEAGEQSPFQQLNGYLGYLDTAGSWASMRKLNVDFPSLQILGGSAPLNVAVKLQKNESAQTDFTVQLKKTGLVVGASGWVNAGQIRGADPFLKSEVKVEAGHVNMGLSLTGFFDGSNARFDGKSQLRFTVDGKTVRAEPNFKLAMNESESVFTAVSAVGDIPGPMVSLDRVDLSIKLPMDNGHAWSERPATFHLSSQIALFFIDKDMRPPLEKSCRCKIPEKVLTEIDGKFFPQFLLNESPERRQIADTNLKVESLDNKLFAANLAAHVKFDRQGKDWIVEPRLDSNLEVRSFQGLRQFLDAKNIMVPSPLDVLDGTIRVSARAAVSRDDKIIRTPIDIELDLKSTTQRVLLSTIVDLNLATNFKALDILVEALIRELKLELPPLDPVLGIPSLSRDSRVQMTPPKKAKHDPNAFKLQVFFKVKTEAAGSVKLLSKLAQPYAPLTLDISNTQGASSGYLRAEPFAITYLRRKLNIERMQITLSEDDKGDFPVGGRVRVDQTSYKIYVDIGGTTSSPSVQLNSEPYLPRNEIISVLLYNRTSENLVSADSETVGSFEAALADRAIGLFGLWAFASTPIRSFSYNSVTKVYTATVDLGEGVSAGVGTNWERAASLEVRKRVSRRWVLTASWSPSESNEQVGKLVLQWEKRF